MFSSIPGLYPGDARIILPQPPQSEISPDIATRPLGDKIFLLRATAYWRALPQALIFPVSSVSKGPNFSLISIMTADLYSYTT